MAIKVAIFFSQKLLKKLSIIPLMLHIIIPRGKLWERIRKISLHNTKAQKVQKTANNKFVSSFDPFGSYTGTDFDYLYEKPIQDADDL